ncbi:MAG: hypothetical protein KAS32_04360 [Candidatus Peribacteraceae bacterium]|nr:hypothetical protein [Candidatus Peribacteraceae bacterium]
MASKKWYESKTVWGAICSGVAVISLGISTHQGTDIMPILETVGIILGAFGIPFTIYGRTKAKADIIK